MRIPRQFPALHGSKERFLTANVVLNCLSDFCICFAVSISDAKQFPEALDFKSFYSPLALCCQCPSLASVRKDGDNQRLVQVVLRFESYVTFQNSG